MKHVVMLMQENRSFDHYFGTLPGVRGFDDPHAMILPHGKTCFTSLTIMPMAIRCPSISTALPATLRNCPPPAMPGRCSIAPGTAAGWTSGCPLTARWMVPTAPTRWAISSGRHPFHFALAEAFTICDAYHCSVMGPTAQPALLADGHDRP
jgi:phospholipase C